MNESKDESDLLKHSPERALRRSRVVALAASGGDGDGQKPPPGPPMPKGAPLRYRTPEYESLVNVYVERLIIARDFAAENPGARGERELAKAREITVAMAPSSRNDRRRSGRGDEGGRGLEFNEARTLLEVQRYAMFEAVARVYGATAVQEQRGRFRVYTKDGARAGRRDRHRFVNVTSEGGMS